MKRPETGDPGVTSYSLFYTDIEGEWNLVNTLLDNNKLTNLILMQSVVVVLLGPIEYPYTW